MFFLCGGCLKWYNCAVTPYYTNSFQVKVFMKFPKSQFSTNAASGSKGSTSYDKRNPISSKYFQTTYNTENTCAYIVRPTSHDHLVEVVNDLNSKGLTYSVVSTGLI